MESSSLFFMLITITTIVLYIIPFIPAWHEWKYKTDAQPFAVNFLDRSIVEYNVRMFKEDIALNYSTLLTEYKDKDSSLQGTFKNGTNYYVSGTADQLDLTSQELSSKRTDKVILLTNKSSLPDGITFDNKVFASDELVAGENNTLNEVYSNKDVYLKQNTIVKKFVYSEGSITLEPGAVLQGYMKALGKIQFLGVAQFRYLHAPIIEFMPTKAIEPTKAVDVIGMIISRKIVDINYVLPEHSDVVSHFVIKSSFYIKNNCKIVGNIKCYKHIKIENNSSIIGAIISEGNIDIADNCFIQGPIVTTNGTIRIGKNCTIGTLDSKTTLIGQSIYIAKGCYVTGLVLAKIEGFFVGDDN